MERRTWRWLAAAAIVGIGAARASAEFPVPDQAEPSAAFAPALFQYVGGQDMKSPCGQFTNAGLAMVSVNDGRRIQVLAPQGTHLKLNPGTLYMCSLENRGFLGLTLRSCDEYTVTPGEDQPGVFIVQRVVRQSSGGQERLGLELSKLGVSTTAWVPMRKGPDGASMPDANLAEQVQRLEKGSAIRVESTRSGAAFSLRSVHPYVPGQNGKNPGAAGGKGRRQGASSG